MSENRTWLWALLVIAIGGALWYRSEVLPASGERQQELTKIMFVPGGTDDYWKLTVKGAEAAAIDHNADLVVMMPAQDEGAAQQMQILVNLGGSDVDGCAVSPLDADGQTQMINRLSEKMDVVTFDSDAPLSDRRYYVGTSNFQAGGICQDLVKEALPGGGKVLVLLSNLTKNNMQERKEGFEDAAKKTTMKSNTADDDNDEESNEESDDQDTNNASWETIAFLTDEGSKETIKANIQQTLKEHDDLACIVGMNGYHGPMILDILEEAGQLGKIKLVTFDEASETLAGIVEGHIYATVAQDPYKYGYEAVRMLTSLHNGKSGELPIVGGGTVTVQCQPIRQGDVEQFKERLKQRLVGDSDEPSTDEPATKESATSAAPSEEDAADTDKETGEEKDAA